MDTRAFFDTIAINVLQRRGYGVGLSNEAILARNLLKLLEEVGELAAHLVLPEELAEKIENLSQTARAYFDDPSNWESKHYITGETRDYPSHMQGMEGEIADILIVGACMARAYKGINPGSLLPMRALIKSSNDIDRGVRASSAPVAPVAIPEQPSQEQPTGEQPRQPITAPTGEPPARAKGKGKRTP